MVNQIPNGQSKNTHSSNIIHTEQGIFKNMCVYTHTSMHITTINGKSHEVETKQRCTRVLREENERN